MILQVGGVALGAISIKSKPLSSAMRKASGTVITPAIVPFSSIKRICCALISRLTRKPSFSRFLSRSNFPGGRGGRGTNVLMANLRS